MRITYNPKFAKDKGAGGKMIYTFSVQDTTFEEEGALLTTTDMDRETLHNLVWTMPESCKMFTEIIISEWLKQCSSAFSTPPPLEKCLSQTVIEVDRTAKVPTIGPEETGREWVLLWKPTRIQIDVPKFILYWAPVQKKEITRIHEPLFLEPVATTPIVNFQVQAPAQAPEQAPVPVLALGLTQGLPQAPVPVLEEVNLDAMDFRPKPTSKSEPKESLLQKDMAKVVAAYEKARHYYEKAEHYNEKFKTKYGFYAVDEDGSETSSFRSEPWTDYEDGDGSEDGTHE
jgi:hypothetical protein